MYGSGYRIFESTFAMPQYFNSVCVLCKQMNYPWGLISNAWHSTRVHLPILVFYTWVILCCELSYYTILRYNMSSLSRIERGGWSTVRYLAVMSERIGGRQYRTYGGLRYYWRWIPVLPVRRIRSSLGILFLQWVVVRFCLWWSLRSSEIR